MISTKLCLLGLLISALSSKTVYSLGFEKIIGGKLVDDNEFPYQVFVSADYRICGGSIIHKNYVITAGHCVAERGKILKNANMYIVAGTNDIKNESKPKVVIKVKRVYVPKDFSHDETLGIEKSDIAVLELTDSLDFTKQPRLSKLWLPKAGKSYYNQVAKITGFGINNIRFVQTTDSEEILQMSTDQKMRSLDVLIMKNIDCQTSFGFNLYNNNICAKVLLNSRTEDQSVCRGDSGGPLVYEGKYLVGVLSYGSSKCNKEHGVAVYTEVKQFVGFIRSVINNIESPNVVCEPIGGNAECNIL